MNAGVLDRQFVSSIEFMDQREIYPYVLDLFNEMGFLVDIMKLSDRFEVTSQEEYHMHSNERLSAAATVNGALAEPAAGADSVIAVTNLSVKPLKGDLMLTPGRFRGYVRSVSGNNITVAPVNEDFPAHEAFLGGESITFFSNAFPEGSDINEGYRWTTTQKTNNIQIIRRFYEVTDLEALTKVEVKFKGQEYYMIKQQIDNFNRFKKDVGYTWLYGERSKGLTEGGKKVWTTHGLEKSIRDHGIDLPLRTDNLDNFGLDLKVMIRAQDQARGPAEYWAMNGPDIHNVMDDWLMTKEGLTNGGIVYNSFSGLGGKERAVEMGFSSFKIYGRTFHMKKLEALDDIGVSAATGHTYPSTVFMVPANKVLINHNDGYVDRFRIRYMEAPKGVGLGVKSSREYYEITGGGLSNNPTNHKLTFTNSYTTWQGCEYAGLEHFSINSFSNGGS
jgi:hypothetical protein